MIMGAVSNEALKEYEVSQEQEAAAEAGSPPDTDASVTDAAEETAALAITAE